MTGFLYNMLKSDGWPVYFCLHQRPWLWVSRSVTVCAATSHLLALAVEVRSILTLFFHSIGQYTSVQRVE